MPVAWDLDDWPYFEHVVTPTHGMTGLRDPDEPLKVWTRELDYLYEHVGRGLLTMHPHYIGHRSRIALLRRLIEHMKSVKGVWFATHRQVAEYCKAEAEKERKLG